MSEDAVNPIPTYDQMIFPLLKVLGTAEGPLPARVLQDRVADYLGLTEAQRLLTLPNSPQEIYRNRAGWAHDRLKRHDLSHSPKRGVWEITPKGLAVLANSPQGLTTEEVKTLAAVDRTPISPTHRIASGDREIAVQEARLISPTIEVQLTTQQSPDEALAASLKEIRDSVAVELLEQLQQTTPTRFESIVLDVLHALGYGLSREDLAEVGRAADAGIDGVISLDKLGLDKVYVQAKRWTSSSVSRPEIQAFYGALAGQRAARGVFITTSTFSKHAIEFANSVDKSIALIDGQRLVHLMIELGVGVSHEIIKRPRLDSDYFEQS